MKYAFIVNPKSGQGKHGNGLIPKINELIANNGDRDIKIYYTQGERDATSLAARIAEQANDKVVIFACGGDGTVQEVVNGVYGHDNAILSVIPVGSGNDFVRTLGGGLKEGSKYLNFMAHLDAPHTKIDLIKMTWQEHGMEQSVMVDNGINIGFDGNTCILAHDYKMLPGVSGTGSYLLAVAKNLIEKRGENIKIVADGKEFHNGPMLLATASNGRFCGGGFESCPRAEITDGLMELLVVNDLTRSRFLQLIPKYKAGKLLEIPDEGGNLYKYAQVKKLEITPNTAPTMQFVADGEIYKTGKLTIEVIHDAISVVQL